MFNTLWKFTKIAHPRITYQQSKIFWSLGFGFLIGIIAVSIYVKIIS